MAAERPVLIVTGPTASGKSALALRLAGEVGGTVINADAMQTYRDLPILTAQPGADERAAVPHVLYGLLDVADMLTAARWRDLAAAEVERAHAAGRVPILTGGSGLYLRTLREGISPVPEVPDAVRAAARADWEAMGGDAFRARLAERDPAIHARLKPNDRQRAIRAWEVLAATGRPLSDWQREKGEGAPAHWRFLTVLIAPDRAVVRDRIERRFDAMLAAGALAEVDAVRRRRLDPVLPGLKAHGYPELSGHLEGRWSLSEARRRSIDITRQYAKRQMTWSRHQILPDMVLDSQDLDIRSQVAQFLSNLET